MKKLTLLASLLILGVSVHAQFDIKDFETTPTGIKYKVERSHPSGKLIKEGDLIIGKFAIYFGDTLIYDGMDRPSEPAIPVIEKNKMFDGDLMDALKTMREKEIITFAFPSDSMKKHPTGVPQDLKADYIYYTVEADSIVSLAEFEKEQELQRQAYLKFADSLKTVEKQEIDKYLTANNWDKTPSDGIYIKILQMGEGEYPVKGDNVRVNYIGQFLDGTLFDTSLEKEAKDAGLYNERRNYEPLKFQIGKGQMIKGFELAAQKLNKGGKAIVLLPSEFAYGDRGVGTIQPFTPLLFTIELVEIMK